jgi:integrase
LERKTGSQLVHKRGGKFYLRVRIPAKLSRTLGRSHLWLSLRTSDRTEAEVRARSASLKLKEFFSMADEAVNAEALFRELVDSIKKDVDHHNLTGPAQTSEEFDRNRMVGLSLMSEYREASALRQREKVYPVLDSFLKERGIKLDPEDYRELAGRFLQAMPDLLQYEADWHLQGTTTTPPSVPSPSSPSSSSLQEALEDYWKETSPGWKARTVRDYEVYRVRLLEFVGPATPLDSIDHRTMKAFKDGLVKFGLSASRVNGHLTFAGAVFRFARRHKMMKADNPVEGIKLKRTGRVDTEKSVFSDDDLGRLFATLPECPKHPYQKWLPLLGLYTGARLEELAQLYREDVREVDGVWCLDINESRPDQSVKNASSARLVPLHPVLIERGFLRYVDGVAQGSRVFPELTRIKDRYSHKVGQWFKNVQTSAGITGKKSFHSFRHTVANHLKRKDVPDHSISELLGHTVGSISVGRYGKRFDPKELLEKAVLKLDFLKEQL